MRTTNALERYHQEARRRSRLVRISPAPATDRRCGAGVPNRASCLRLSSGLAMEQSEDWLTGHRYLDMQPLEDHQPETASLVVPVPIEAEV